MTAPDSPSLADLRSRLPELTLRDEHRLRRRLDSARGPRKADLLAKIAADLDRAELRIAARRAAAPEITYPPQLPVSQRKDDIAAAIRDHQVVVIAGETGSGKTTQIPKICLELGRGVRGLIGHTQPRRLAARTVAERVAQELKSELGETVGYKVRFTDSVGDATMVKLMTDGILLAELQSDRMLRQYDTIIVDEAHERSLNIDFILGYLKQLLPRRPDLKVVITSATIDPERFAEHFAAPDGTPAPIVEVSGRTYPVEVRYRPIVDPDDPAADPDRDQTQAIMDAVEELWTEGPGDILVFCSGEREIRDTADALSRDGLPDTEVLPLYARLSSAEQHRVFKRGSRRRVVLATNVAETSLTVPGIKYVVDPGTARISRYSHRTKVQRLPIEKISQASANQRKGRCGRTSDGVCIRLYAEDDFDARPEFTDPEILRTNLASVILQMTAAGLGDVAAFPFVDPPDKRNIADGVALLQELGALQEPGPDGRQRLTEVGRTLAQLPVDPRLARMVLAAGDQGCVTDVLVIASALSIQDPRERPADHLEAARAKHARFADPISDFAAYLNLWRHLRTQQRELTGNQFRRLCRSDYLNYLRVREWQDLHGQLRQVARGLGLDTRGEPGEPDHERIHRALLPGLLSHLGLKEGAKNEYLGARGAKFGVFPGSALFKKPPRFVMAAELVETSRLWGRIVARIEPEWAEEAGAHLVKRTHSEPHWEKKRGSVVAIERVTLYGVPLVVGRRVQYGTIDPVVSRELFIRHALVEGDWETRHRFFHDNRAMLDEVAELEDRARRRGIVVDDETLFAFYDARIPASVVSGAHFDSWWKKARRGQPDLLTYTPDMLVRDESGALDAADHPDHWQAGWSGPTSAHVELPLRYQFEPGASSDGVSVDLPLGLLNQVDPDTFTWQVPGRREELVTALIRSLPKALRINFVPAPDWARRALAGIVPYQGSLYAALAAELRALTGVAVPVSAFELDKLPPHLRITIRVLGDDGKVVAEDKDLAVLRDKLRPSLRASLTAASGGLERHGCTSWVFGTLPRVHHEEARGYQLTGYPALVDEGSSVGVRVFETPAEQARSMWAGTRRLALLGTPAPYRLVQGRLGNHAKLALTRNPYADMGAFFEDCARCAADHLIRQAGGPAWDEAGFKRVADHVRAGLRDATYTVVRTVEQVLTAAYELRARLVPGRVPEPALSDLTRQLDGLVHAGFVAETGYDRLPDLLRYLRGMEYRLDKLPQKLDRDADWTAGIEAATAEYRALAASLPAGTPGLADIRWMIEELRVSWFAQPVGVPRPVSEKRIYRAIDELAPA